MIQEKPIFSQNIDISHIKCSNNNPIQLFCTNQDCKHSYIICQKEQCSECIQTKIKQQKNLSQVKHSKCSFVNAQSLVNSINNKKGSIANSYQSTINKILEIYDQTIDALSKQRQHIQDCIKNYGLTLSQITFINKINQNTLQAQFLKQQFLEVVSHSKNIRQLNVNMIYDHLQKTWKQKQAQLLSYFKFRQDKFFTIIDKNEVFIEQYDQKKLFDQYKFLNRQNLKGLIIINQSNQGLRSQFIQTLSQFKQLERLNIYSSSFNFKSVEFLSAVSSLPKIQQIKIVSQVNLQSNVLKEILQLKSIKKVSIFSDIQFPFRKKYERNLFFDNKFQKQNIKFDLKVDVKALEKQQYWNSCSSIGQQQTNLKSLKHYNISNIQYNLADTFQKVLSNSNKLLSLRIHKSTILIRNGTYNYWPLIQSLRRLQLSNCEGFTSADLRQICKNCKHLEHIALDDIIPERFNYRPLRNLTKLKSLSLSNKKVIQQEPQQTVYYLGDLFDQGQQQQDQKLQRELNEETLNQNQWLGKLVNLKTLNLLNNNHFNFDWLFHIKKLRKLQFLALNSPKQKIESITCLRHLIRLKTFILQNQVPYNLITKILNKMTKLTKLKLGTKFQKQFLNEIKSRIKNVEYLSINKSYTLDIKQFYVFQKLKYLDLKNSIPDIKIINQCKQKGIILKNKVQYINVPKMKEVYRMHQSQEQEYDLGFGLFD